MRIGVITCLVGLITGLDGGTAWAGDDRGDPPPAARSRSPEFFEMLWSILGKGSQMGPGEGWFHPAQSRYEWRWLAEQFDPDKDGAITKEELRAHPELFERLDRDHDGRARADDLDWSEKSAYLRGRGMARGRFSLFDINSNGRISRDEWEALFARAAKGKKYLTPDDLADLLFSAPPAPPKESTSKRPADNGPSKATLVLGLLSGELGSPFEGPPIGAAAPDFTLQTVDGKRRISLAEYRGKKPVVLIFGSFT